MVSGCGGFLGVLAPTFGLPWSFTARFRAQSFKNLSSASLIDRGGLPCDPTGVQEGNMPTSITLNDRLAERVAVLAAEAGQPVDAFVERVLQGLVDADIEIRDGIPVFRMPPDAPTLTSEDVDRLLHSDLHQ